MNRYEGNEERGKYELPIQQYIDREEALYGLWQRIAKRLPSYRQSHGMPKLDGTVRATKLYTPLDVHRSPRGLTGLWQVALTEVRLIVPDKHVNVQQRVTVVPDRSTASYAVEGGDTYRRPMWRIENANPDVLVPAHEPRRLHTERHVLEPRQLTCGAWLNIAALEVGVELSPEFSVPPSPDL
jgi:hypothetical protein